MALGAGQARPCEVPVLVHCARPGIDELVAVSGQIAHGLLCGRRRRLRVYLVDVGEPCDDGSVDPVRLGQDAVGTCVVADVAGVEDDEGELSRGEGVGEGAFVAPGGLEGNQARLSVAAVLNEGPQAIRGGLEAPGLSSGVGSQVEPVLSNVNADVEGRAHAVSSLRPAVSCLVIRARCKTAQATVRTADRAVNGGGAVKLTCGLVGPRMGRPAPPSITIQGWGWTGGEGAGGLAISSGVEKSLGFAPLMVSLSNHPRHSREDGNLAALRGRAGGACHAERSAAESKHLSGSAH